MYFWTRIDIKIKYNIIYIKIEHFIFELIHEHIIVVKPKLMTYLICCCEGPRTEEGIVELLVLLLRHHMPEKGVHPRRGGEETKVSWSSRWEG